VTDDLRLDEPPDDLPDDRDPTAALLAAVLHREADAVDPSPDGYARIRAEIARRQPPRRHLPRGRSLAPLLAAAAALVVIAAAGTAVVRSATQHPDGATAGGGIVLHTLEQNDVAAAPDATLPVYVAARQNGRIVLFREFRRQSVRGDAATQVETAVRLALATPPRDGDYVRLFATPLAPTVRAAVTDRLVTVDITPAPQPAAGSATQEEATAAVQQLVWTATAAAAVATRPSGTQAAPVRSVRLTLGGRPSQALFGLVPLGRALDRQFGGDPRAPAWVIDPAEGTALPAGALAAAGDAVADEEAKVHLTLVRDGTTVSEQDVPLTPADDTPGPVRPGQRGTWRVAGLDGSVPGTYRLEVSTTDEDGRRWSDTKTFTTG
jgi:hypothetical protein